MSGLKKRPLELAAVAAESDDDSQKTILETPPPEVPKKKVHFAEGVKSDSLPEVLDGALIAAEVDELFGLIGPDRDKTPGMIGTMKSQCEGVLKRMADFNRYSAAMYRPTDLPLKAKISYLEAMAKNRLQGELNKELKRSTSSKAKAKKKSKSTTTRILKNTYHRDSHAKFCEAAEFFCQAGESLEAENEYWFNMARSLGYAAFEARSIYSLKLNEYSDEDFSLAIETARLATKLFEAFSLIFEADHPFHQKALSNCKKLHCLVENPDEDDDYDIWLIGSKPEDSALTKLSDRLKERVKSICEKAKAMSPAADPSPVPPTPSGTVPPVSLTPFHEYQIAAQDPDLLCYEELLEPEKV